MTRKRGVPSWALAAAVVALVVPGTLAFALAGPAVGLGVGFVLAAVVLLVAARRGRHARIEVAARAPHPRSSLIVLATDPDEGGAVDDLAERCRGRAADVMLLAATDARRLERWLSATDDAHADARRHLELWQAALASRGLDVRGQVGDREAPLDRAVQDALRTFPADEVVLIAPRDGGRAGVDLQSRLDIPVARITTGAREPRGAPRVERAERHVSPS